MLRRFSKVYPAAETFEVAGGVGLYSGPGSPINVVKGMLQAPSPEELARIEQFFQRHNLDSFLELSPEIPPPPGYRHVATEDVMLRTPSATGVGAAESTDYPALRQMLAAAFGVDVGEEFLRVEGARSFVIAVNQHVDQHLAATGQIIDCGGIGVLAGDATVPAFRSCGLQRRLIEARMQTAYEANLSWLTAETQPNSTSQRNYVRCGFEILYSRSHWIRELPRIS